MLNDLMEIEVSLTQNQRKEINETMKKLLKLSKEEIMNKDFSRVDEKERRIVEEEVKTLEKRHKFDFKTFRQLKKEIKYDYQKLFKEIRSIHEIKKWVIYYNLIIFYFLARLNNLLPQGIFFKVFDEIREELNDERWWAPLLIKKYKKAPEIKGVNIVNKNIEEMSEEYFSLKKKYDRISNSRDVEKKRLARVLNLKMNYLLNKIHNKWRGEVETLSGKAKEDKIKELQNEVEKILNSNVWEVREYFRAKGFKESDKILGRINKQVQLVDLKFDELKIKLQWIRKTGVDGEICRRWEDLEIKKLKEVVNLERGLSLNDLRLRELALKTLRICNERENRENYALYHNTSLKKHIKSCELKASESVKRLLRVVNGDVLRIKRVLTREEWSHPKKGLKSYLDEYLRTGLVKFYNKIVYF